MAETRIYLREWRTYRNLTQRQVVDRLSALNDEKLPQTEASLSRLENGKQPYSQRVLEALAEVYSTEPSDLIGRNPFKEGEIIDMFSAMDDLQKLQAKAVLRALANG